MWLMQQDLALWEEHLNYTLHALSFAKTLSTRARVTYQRVHADHNNNNSATTETHFKRVKRKATTSFVDCTSVN